MYWIKIFWRESGIWSSSLLSLFCSIADLRDIVCLFVCLFLSFITSSSLYIISQQRDQLIAASVESGRLTQYVTLIIRRIFPLC